MSEAHDTARAALPNNAQDFSSHPLPGLLLVAVPLWIAELQETPLPRRIRRIEQWCAQAADILERNGEAILYRTEKGKSAESFNALARALAALSFVPGGVTLFGTHWET